MLLPQTIVNLLQQACVSVVSVGHRYCIHVDVVAIALTQRQRYSDYNYSEGDKLD